jgi:predicted Rossmann fold nucleotide-binding protein DprA/Smf involved in DNA uptake
MTKSEALKLEYSIKQGPAGKKISELKKEGSRMTIKKDLQALNKDVKALGKTIDNLLKTVEKSENPKFTKKATAKSVKAKPTKRDPAKKTPARKRTAKLTATDKVLKIVMGRKKGVDTSTIMAKTGFNQKKVWAILLRAYKTGKIKRIDRGVYVGA